MSSGNNGYRRLGKPDLRGFNQPAQDTILAAMEAGGVARVSNKGHCIIRAPKGGTMSVSRDPSRNNRGIQNQEAAFKRIFGMTVGEVQVQAAAREAAEPAAKAPLPEPTPLEPTLACRANGCEAVFVTEGARYSHEHGEGHYPCQQPGCEFVSRHAPATNNHHASIHLGLKRGGRPKKAVVSSAGPVVSSAQVEAKAPRVTAKPAGRPAEVPSAAQYAVQQLSRIRDVLGPDPRVKELQRRLDESAESLSKARARIDELEAKIKLMKEALEL